MRLRLRGLGRLRGWRRSRLPIVSMMGEVRMACARSRRDVSRQDNRERPDQGRRKGRTVETRGLPQPLAMATWAPPARLKSMTSSQLRLSAV